jgi:glycerate 2-kinase
VRVLIAPDKFKGSLAAVDVAAALAAGVLAGRPDVEVVRLPVADGGDGTVDAAVSVGFERVPVESVGPTGEPVHASYAVSGTRAVVELADAVGLDRLPGGRFDPLGASTYGLGLVIADAIRHGAEQIVLGVGGSASTDGGAGMVQALGARVVGTGGRPVGRGGGALLDVASVDLGGLRELVGDTRFLVASDVDNPLLGERGAASVFGPQKGAGPSELETLERGLRRWAAVVAEATGTDHAGTPGAGAAGGTAFAALAVLGADLQPGIELMLDLIEFQDALPGADLVITGEGSLDEQSLAGKAPVGVAQAVGATGIPVVAVAGRCEVTPAQLAEVGIARAYTLAELEPDVARSMTNAAALLTRVGERIAAEWLT